MAELEHEETIPANARTVFATATDVTALEAWLPDGVQVEADGPDRLIGRALVSDEVHEARAYWAVDRDRLRAEWGDLAGHGYSGWLAVEETTPGVCRVTLHVDFLGEQPEAVGGEAHERADEHLREALERLAAVATRA